MFSSLQAPNNCVSPSTRCLTSLCFSVFSPLCKNNGLVPSLPLGVLSELMRHQGKKLSTFFFPSENAGM